MKQMQNVRAEIVPLIRDVCMKLTGHARDNEVRLMLGTAAVESGLKYRRQHNDGPARGIWQMEPGMTGAEDIFRNHLEFRYKRNRILVREFLGMEGIQFYTPTVDRLELYLELYDDFACAMARIKYLRDPDPLPATLEGQAKYWKRVYNTPAGKGTVEHYLEMWESCEGEKLMNGEVM